MMNSASLSPSALNVGCMYFVSYIPTDVTGSARIGLSGPKEGDEVREQGHA